MAFVNKAVFICTGHDLEGYDLPLVVSVNPYSQIEYWRQPGSSMQRAEVLLVRCNSQFNANYKTNPRKTRLNGKNTAVKFAIK